MGKTGGFHGLYVFTEEVPTADKTRIEKRKRLFTCASARSSTITSHLFLDRKSMGTPRNWTTSAIPLSHFPVLSDDFSRAD